MDLTCSSHHTASPCSTPAFIFSKSSAAEQHTSRCRQLSTTQQTDRPVKASGSGRSSANADSTSWDRLGKQHTQPRTADMTFPLSHSVSPSRTHRRHTLTDSPSQPPPLSGPDTINRWAETACRDAETYCKQLKINTTQTNPHTAHPYND